MGSLSPMDAGRSHTSPPCTTSAGIEYKVDKDFLSPYNVYQVF